MDRQEIRKVLDKIKSKAPEGAPLHTIYGWGGFIDILEEAKKKK
jgi:hypothetical protein